MLRPIRTAVLAVLSPLAVATSAALAAAPLELPAGTGSEVIASNCTACHSADHTLNQPSLSREEWHTVVDKMITAYRAPITPEDAKVIVDYLARVKGEP
jgi:cytochrome c5